MKIFNLIDISFVQVYLSKYYITQNIDYEFRKPDRSNIRTIISEISDYKPDLILLQDGFEDFDGYDIVTELRAKKINSFIGILSFNSTIYNPEKLAKLTSTNENVEFFSGKGDEITDYINDIVRRIEKSKVMNQEKKRYKILFVDDNKMMHDVISNIINTSSYELLHALDGLEGLDMYRANQPDMVITDIEMPMMNGLELCREIKEHNQGRYIPVIILSSKDSKMNQEVAFIYGADDFLVKPVEKSKLLDKIETFFENISRNKNSKVLVIHESKPTLEIIRHALLKNGINVISSENGIDGYKMVLGESPEIIIIEDDLPGIKGYDICKKIREKAEYDAVKIIAITKSDELNEKKRWEEISVTKTMKKPFDVDKLVNQVEQLIIEKYNNYKKESEYMLTGIRLLIKALEARDKYTKGHTDRVSLFSVKLGRYLNMTQKELEDLELAANLHDIGKIGVRDSVLLKNQSLTDEEYADIQKHAVIGAEILRPMNSLKNVIPLVLLHHERWDGKGYPTAIGGSSIPLGARIIAIADTFDAMTSNRPYRKKLPLEEALEVIGKMAGSQFCPETASAFIEMIRQDIAKGEKY